jgi:hypothetical protein
LGASDIFERRQDALSNLVSPSALFDALLHQIEGIPDGHYVAVIGGRGVLEFGFSSRRGLFYPRIAGGMVVLFFCVPALS